MVVSRFLLPDYFQPCSWNSSLLSTQVQYYLAVVSYFEMENHRCTMYIWFLNCIPKKVYTHLCGTTLPFDYAQYETNNVRNELITSAFFSMCVCHFPQFYIAFCGLFITNSSQSVDEITPKSQFLLNFWYENRNMYNLMLFKMKNSFCIWQYWTIPISKQ